ncbi:MULTISPECIES: type II toxin-antitoxin system VapC family toxin [unclassified Luteococcus]|uniref:type II toxin-antitoxin system VapC family toxin n=1 Tax=unclassified Luteococcus TaxID=2639923 RepID=UPI00313E6966
MIVDTSAAVAILRREPDTEALEETLLGAARLRMSAASVLELAMVTGDDALVDDFLRQLGIEVLAVDAEHLRWARHAHSHYGRRSGSPARLNYGDCLAYGAAKATGEPLLFKGEDFGHTDVARANPASG